MTLHATRHDTRWTAALAAILSVGVLALVASVALQSPRGQRWDDWALSTVFAGENARTTLLSGLGYVSIAGVTVVAGACVVLALSRGQVRLAAIALTLIAGANITTQLLKHVVLTRPDYGFSTLNSLPSGHTTVVASAAAALILVSPRALRVVFAGLGSFAITMTGASTIVAGWHRPADVVAALAVCLAWTGAAALVADGERRADPGSAFASVLGAAAALLSLIAVGVRPMSGWDGLRLGGLVLAAVVLVTALFVWAAAAISPSA